MGPRKVKTGVEPTAHLFNGNAAWLALFGLRDEDVQHTIREACLDTIRVDPVPEAQAPEEAALPALQPVVLRIRVLLWKHPLTTNFEDAILECECHVLAGQPR